MKNNLDLNWTDLVSPTMSPDDYLREFGDKISYNYKVYEPKVDILREIEAVLKNNSEQLKIVALGADWCPDCNMSLQKMRGMI